MSFQIADPNKIDGTCLIGYIEISPVNLIKKFGFPLRRTCLIHGAGRPGVCQLGCLVEGGSHCLRVLFRFGISCPGVAAATRRHGLCTKGARRAWPGRIQKTQNQKLGPVRQRT